MTLLPGWKLRVLVLMAPMLALPAGSIGETTTSQATKTPATVVTTRTAASAKAPTTARATSKRAEPGAAPRIAGPHASQTRFRPAPPTRAADGLIYIPRELAQVPTQDMDEADFEGISEPPGGDVTHPTLANRTFPFRSEVVGANVRANDTSGDPAGIANSENAIAANGSQVVAGWNDGKGFGTSPGGSGFSYSSDGGLSFTDGGVPPAVAGSIYFGDPSLAVDNAGNFYYANLYSHDGGPRPTAISVNHGTFTGPNFAFDPPVMAAGPDLVNVLDKEWVACDRVNGNVYVTYTRFLAAGGNQIEFTRSTNQGATWSPPILLTSPAIENVQGSRVAVGPSGEIQVLYLVYDVATQNNYMRTRRSADGGLTWGIEVTLPAGPNGIFSNYGSGSPGFNRARGIGFPSMTIDRTAGSNSGRIYATWEETFNYYFDPLGGLGVINETEGNGSQATANPVTIGQEVHGVMSSTADLDFFKFDGVAGDKIILYLTPGSPTAGDGFMRLFCGGTGTGNRAMLSYIGFGTGLIVYTLPSTGTYYFRVSANTASIGNYVVYTGSHVASVEDIARDTRDVIVQTSADGLVWDARRVVNDDLPRFDNAFPEVAVDAAGQVYIDWMDHRGDPCGIGTDVYYTRSATGGASWGGSLKVNDGPPVNWSLVSSNLAPNFGDYWNLVADGCNVYANFADGRQGTPDSWVATINECATPTLIAVTHALAEPDHVDLGWYASDAAELVATIFRREPGGEWSQIGTTRSDGGGQISFRDVAVRAGTRYGYRLGITGDAGVEYFGEVWVDVPAEMGLAIRALSNPVTEELTVSFSLPSGAPGTIELLDVAGRAIQTVKVDASGRARLGGPGLAAGVYVVKLTQAGRSVTARTVVVR